MAGLVEGSFWAAMPQTGSHALDVAGGEHVPQRYMVAQQQIGALGVALGHRLVEQRRQHAPEPILRMAVEKPRLPRFRRRHRAQHEHLRPSIEHRRNAVLYRLRLPLRLFRHPTLPFPTVFP